MTADDGRPRNEAIARALALSAGLTTNICEVLLASAGGIGRGQGVITVSRQLVLEEQRRVADVPAVEDQYRDFGGGQSGGRRLVVVWSMSLPRARRGSRWSRNGRAGRRRRQVGRRRGRRAAGAGQHEDTDHHGQDYDQGRSKGLERPRVSPVSPGSRSASPARRSGGAQRSRRRRLPAGHRWMPTVAAHAPACSPPTPAGRALRHARVHAVPSGPTLPPGGDAIKNPGQSLAAGLSVAR